MISINYYLIYIYIKKIIVFRLIYIFKKEFYQVLLMKYLRELPNYITVFSNTSEFD